MTKNLVSIRIMGAVIAVLAVFGLWIALTPTGVAADEHNHAAEVKTQPVDKHDDEGHDLDADHAEENHEGHGPGCNSGTEETTDGHDEEAHAGEEAGHENHDDGLAVELSPDGITMAGIALARAEHGRITRTIDLPGEVGFNEDRLVRIAPRFAGIIIKANYRVGDFVNTGDVVAVIESNESLNTYSIKSPISGWVTKRNFTPGEYVSEENSIFEIADLSTVWVNLAVYPKDADRIKPGMEVQIRAIGSDSQTRGAIDYITPILDVRTRSITARVVLPNPNNRWRPGTFVSARGVIGARDEGLVVKKDAVQVLDEVSVVFVTDGPGRFEPRDVVTGENDDDHIRIVSGLEEGEEYVARGAFELKAKIVTSSLGGHAGHGH